MSRSKPIIAINLQTGEETEYEYVAKAGRALGISNSSIWLVCHKRQESTRGYTFRYVEAEVDPRLTKSEAEVIEALASSGLSPIGAARKIYKSNHSILYHCRAIREKTGKDPRDFYDMCELLPKAKAILEEEQCS